MIERSNEENLGFKGYPPELAIYRSLLQQNNIHGKSDTGYQMFDFKDYKDLGLQQMAQEFYSFLDQNSDRKVNLTEILEKWPFNLQDLSTVTATLILSILEWSLLLCPAPFKDSLPNITENFQSALKAVLQFFANPKSGKG